MNTEKEYFKNLYEEMKTRTYTDKEIADTVSIACDQAYIDFLDLNVSHPLNDALFEHFLIENTYRNPEPVCKQLKKLSLTRQLELFDILQRASCNLNPRAWNVVLHFIGLVPDNDLIEVITKMPKVGYYTGTEELLKTCSPTKAVATALLQKINFRAVNRYQNITEKVSESTGTSKEIPGFSDFSATTKAEFLKTKGLSPEYVKRSLRAVSTLKGFQFSSEYLIYPIKYEYYKDIPVEDYCNLLEKLLSAVLATNETPIENINNIELPPVDTLEEKFAIAFIRDSKRKDYFNGLKHLVLGGHNQRKVGKSASYYFYMLIEDYAGPEKEKRPINWKTFQETILTWVGDNAKEPNYKSIQETALTICDWLGKNYAGNDLAYRYSNADFPNCFYEKEEVNMLEWLKVMHASKIKPKFKNLNRMFGLL